MNSISHKEANKRRRLFVRQIKARLGEFCDLAKYYHPEHSICEPFIPQGHKQCIKYGSFNLCVFVRSKTPKNNEWVIQVPFPDSSPWIEERLQSKVATMIYVAAKTTIPLPRIHAYSFASDNLIRSPFMIMDYHKGKSLGELKFQNGMATPQKMVEKVYKQLGHVYLQLRQLEFPEIGSLHLPDDPNPHRYDGVADGISARGRPITVNMAQQKMEDYGPDSIIKPGTTFRTAGDFVTALAKLSENQLQKSPDLGLDLRRGRSLLYANYAFHRFVSEQWLKDNDGPFVLMHGDISSHNHNILFDQNFNLVAVIDWEWSFVAPLQFLISPVWLTGSGFGFVVKQSAWYDREARKLLCQIETLKHKLQARSSRTNVQVGALNTAVITALLDPENTHETFWGLVFWAQCNDDGSPFSKDHIIPILERFMDSEYNQSLLKRKYREQVEFWQREMQYLGNKERPRLMDGEEGV